MRTQTASKAFQILKPLPQNAVTLTQKVIQNKTQTRLGSSIQKTPSFNTAYIPPSPPLKPLYPTNPQTSRLQPAYLKP